MFPVYVHIRSPMSSPLAHDLPVGWLLCEWVLEDPSPEPIQGVSLKKSYSQSFSHARCPKSRILYAAVLLIA